MKRYKVAVLDDYQNVALRSADWSLLRDRADITIFQDHLADPGAVIERLLPFDVVCVMRERTPLPRNVLERLPSLKLIASTGSGISTSYSTSMCGGTLFTVQKALPLLKDGCSIILNGSVASVKGTAAFGVYAASKAAIRSFVRTWTTDLKDRRIRSNVVSPGPINTPLASRQSADVIARIVSTVPMGRMGQPEEVAKVALFLASDDSSFVTGIELCVDGGRAQI